jgi:hypothetical protein
MSEDRQQDDCADQDFGFHAWLAIFLDLPQNQSQKPVFLEKTGFQTDCITWQSKTCDVPVKIESKNLGHLMHRLSFQSHVHLGHSVSTRLASVIS